MLPTNQKIKNNSYLAAMKKINLIVSTCIVVLLVASVVLISCNKEKTIKYNGTFFNLCDNDTCYNNGVCYNGKCQCPAGYEGMQCLQTWNGRYVADYQVNNNCNPGNNFNINITPVVNEPTAFLINGINYFCPANTAIPIRASIVTNSTNIEIAKQRLCGDMYVSGNGSQSIDTKTFTLTLTARDSISKVTKECYFTLKKL